MTKKLCAFLVLALLIVLAALVVFTVRSPSRLDGRSESPGRGTVSARVVIGFSQVGSESDWRTANSKSMREAFTEEKGYRLLFDDAQNNIDNQIAAVRNFINRRVDYLVIAPVLESGLDEVLREARAAGIPVIIADRMINVDDDSLYVSSVVSDFRKEGDTAVKWMEKVFAGRESLKIVHLQGVIGSSAQLGRTEGLMAGLARNSNWNLVVQKSGDFMQKNGQEIMERLLEAGIDFDVLLIENDNMAFGAIDALVTANRKISLGDGVTIISFDATRAGLQETLAGRIHLNVECNPLHGPRVEEIITKLRAGEPVEKITYVAETFFETTTITQEMIDARGY